MIEKGRKVIGIGETVYDIIFKNAQPIAAKPGGSTFNALVSLGRTNTLTTFISDIGKDKVGNIILDFLAENQVDAQFVNRHKACKTAISLAFLNDKNDAEYEFYKDYLNQNPHTEIPEINENDIVLFGSFYAINPNIRHILLQLLEEAKKNKAIIYYDPNFRASHLPELQQLKPTLLENMSYATFVRGSDEDFKNIFETENIKQVYQLVNKSDTNLIVTRNKDGVDFLASKNSGHVSAKKIEPISTIGAGDSFNAGFIYALIAHKISFAEIAQLSTNKWEKLISTAIEFSSEVCMSYDNYISVDFAQEITKRNNI